MGWTESKRRTTRALVQAIKDLRQHLGETQTGFADQLGLSKRAIINYEQDHRPTAAVLARLAKLASDENRGDLVMEFMTSLGEDLDLDKIKGGTLSWSQSEKRGYLLSQFEGEQDRRLATAFFTAVYRSHASNPEGRRAKQALKRFADDILGDHKG